MSFIGYGMGSAWQSIAYGIAVAGYMIALVVVAAVAAFAPGCAKPGWSASGLGSEQFLISATERDGASKSRILWI